MRGGIKMIFKIPVSWECFGVIEVEAETIADAIEKFDAEEAYGDGYSLPHGDYIDGSFRREYDEEFIEFMQ